MKKLAITSLVFLTALSINVNAQDTPSPEKFGNTLNIAAGVGYYGYVNHPLPVGIVNYEFDVVRNFTLAPFIGVYSYNDYSYWGDPNKPNQDPSYREYSYNTTIVPIGVKGSYYFDQLFHAGPKWDFYAAGSVGFTLKEVVWENAYYGDKHAYQSTSPLYLNAHIGTEYHMNQKAGLVLDLSSGVSTFGLAIHF